MPWFAVFHIPEADSELYRLGSSVLGYDVRAQQRVPLAPEVAARTGLLPDEWVTWAQPLGFHMTIGDVVEFPAGDLVTIERELEDLLGCLDPDRPFKLRAHSEGLVRFFNPSRNALVLAYEPNAQLQMLHTLVVARLNPLGVTSYQQRYLQDPNQYGNRPHVIRRIRKFGSAYGLDTWIPHFTLLLPYPGPDYDRIADLFSDVFGCFSEIKVRSVCLLLKGDDGFWRVWREFCR